MGVVGVGALTAVNADRVEEGGADGFAALCRSVYLVCRWRERMLTGHWYQGVGERLTTCVRNDRLPPITGRAK
jgi:hypothetical protein